ncbi:MAG: hypothetical protein ACLQDY_26565 [Streptosporangiaceae bacterium]
MTQTDAVQHYADAIMIMIKEDQDSGQVSAAASTWDELDESVDLDDYFRRAELPSGTHEANELRQAVSAEVDRRLASTQGGPWGVRWTHPDGRAHVISRSIGHATRAEAEAVGQEYCTVHGGKYEVLGG